MMSIEGRWIDFYPLALLQTPLSSSGASTQTQSVTCSGACMTLICSKYSSFCTKHNIDFTLNMNTHGD